MTKEAKEKKNKKDMKKVDKNNKKKKEKVRKETYFEGDRNELAKVKWPTKKEVFKYTMATIIFMIILVGFFILLSILMSAIKGAFN